MKGLTFDPKTHTYTLKGLPIPSVTQVIAGTQDFSGVSEEVLEAARGRGCRVHAATALYDTGGWTPEVEEAADSEICSYLEAWARFREDTGFAPFLVEKEVFSPKYRYAGTIDRIGRLQGKLTILDIKTAASPGRLHPAVGLQLAAYQQAHNERSALGRADGRYAVQLRPDGKYTLTQYTDRADLSVFLACLTLHNWRQRHT